MAASQETGEVRRLGHIKLTLHAPGDRHDGTTGWFRSVLTEEGKQRTAFTVWEQYGKVGHVTWEDERQDD